MTKLLLLLLLLFPLTASAEWTSGGLDQPGNASGNGDMISVGNTLIFWNGDLGIVRSTDNGATWQDVDPSDNSGQNGSVARFAASNGKIWAARSYGTGTGMLTVSTDDGLTWKPDTVGSQCHALGWDGYAVISDMYAWDGYLFVKWDAPDAYDIRKPDGTYTRPAYWKTNDPHSVVAIGSTLYSISSGLSISTDHGVTWQKPANSGFPFSATTIQADGERLYILGTEGFNQPNHLWYSDDKGASWTKISAAGVSDRLGLGDVYTSITAYFAKGENIFLGTQPTHFYGSRPNVFRSTNGGITWAVDTNGLGIPYYSSVVGFNYHADGQIWVIPGLDGIYNQKLDNGGGGGSTLAGSPKLLSPKNGSALQDAGVRFIWSSVAGATKYQLQISSSVDFTTLVHNDSNVVDTTKFLTLEKGQQYFWRVRGLAPDKANPKGGGIVLKLSGWSTGMFSISIDRSGWENMGVSGIMEMTLHKGALYVATDKGLLKSADDGKTWTTLPADQLIGTTTTQVVSAGERLYVLGYGQSGDYHLLYTTNDGATWSTDTAGMTDAAYSGDLMYYADHLLVRKAAVGQTFHKHINDAAWIEDVTSKGINYVANGSTLFTDGAITGKGYQKSTDFGATWQPIEGPKTGPDGEEGMYAFEGKLYAFTQEDSPSDSISMFVSTDNGASWTEKALGAFAAPEAPQFGNQLAVPSFLVDGDRMWISIEYGRDLDVVYRSLDGGATWKIDTAGAWEQLKGAHFNRMIMDEGPVWAMSGGPEMGLGTLYRQMIDPSEQGPALTAPTLLSPANEAVMPDADFDYTWSTVAGATSYQLQVSWQDNFAQLQMNDSLVAGTSRANIVPAVIPFFYWRVRALNGKEVGPWSNTNFFTVMLQSVSADDKLSAQRVQVYPNPVVGSAVSLTSIDGMTNVQIIDLLGNTKLVVPMNGECEVSLSVQELAAGAYCMIVTTREGSRYLRKLVIP